MLVAAPYRDGDREQRGAELAPHRQKAMGTEAPPQRRPTLFRLWISSARESGGGDRGDHLLSQLDHRLWRLYHRLQLADRHATRMVRIPRVEQTVVHLWGHVQAKHRHRAPELVLKGKAGGGVMRSAAYPEKRQATTMGRCGSRSGVRQTSGGCMRRRGLSQPLYKYGEQICSIRRKELSQRLL